MARIIKMPGKNELPEGPRRDFVEELRQYYRWASRPPLRRVSSLIEGRADLKEVTASQETVRRILRGTVIPTDWNRVNAVFQVFCEIGEIDPDADRWEDSYNGGGESKREYVRRLWDTALEDEPDSPGSRGRPHPGRSRLQLPGGSAVTTHGRQARRSSAPIRKRPYPVQPVPGQRTLSL